MQQTIILDYENSRVIIWNNKNEDDIEEQIYNTFNLKSSSIEWLSWKNIKIEFINK